MKKLKKDNAVIQTKDPLKEKELKLRGYKEVDKNGKVIEEQYESGVSQAEFDKLQDAYQKQGQELDEAKQEVLDAQEESKQLAEDNEKLQKDLDKAQKDLEKAKKDNK